MSNLRLAVAVTVTVKLGVVYIHSFIHSHIHIHFIVSEKVCNLTIQTEEVQIQQEQAKAHRAYRRSVPKFSC